MPETMQTIVLIVMAAVAIVLLFGLGNMMKGDNVNRSQKLMRLRVVVQAVAVVLIVATVYFAR